MNILHDYDDLSDLTPEQAQAENDRIRRGEDDLDDLIETRPLTTIEEVAAVVLLIREVLDTQGTDAPFGRVWGTMAQEARGYRQ